MLEFRRFIPADLKCINDWLRARDIPETTIDEIPNIGYVAVLESGPVSAIFLRRAEGNIGIIDGLVTDAGAHKEIRHEAVTTLVDTIIDHAKTIHLRALMFFSVEESVFARAKALGFKDPGFKVMRLNLSGGPQCF